MAKLKERVDGVFDEARLLVLGACLLVGFQYRAFLETGFDALPISSQVLKLVALFGMLAAVAMLVSPSAYRRIVERGENTEELYRYAARMMIFALLPFALGVGVDLYVAVAKVLGFRWGFAAGVLALAAAAFFWYALALFRRRQGAAAKEETLVERVGEATGGEGTDLKEKVGQLLTEARLILPGAQALLGFQFVAVLTGSFDALPDGAKYVHLASLFLMALAVVLLMTPSAYHRIVERGESTEHFQRFAGRTLLAAMVPLALGICGDVYVVVRKVTDSQLLSVVGALVVLAIFWELWFGITLYRRTQRRFER